MGNIAVVEIPIDGWAKVIVRGGSRGIVVLIAEMKIEHIVDSVKRASCLDLMGGQEL